MKMEEIMKKIIILLIIVFISITVTIPTYANETKNSEELSYTEKEFIESIENEQNFSSMDENIVISREQSNQIMVIQYLEDETILYTMTDPCNQYSNDYWKTIVKKVY